MKKLPFIILFVMVLATAGIYVLIPGTINISKLTTFACTENGAERVIYHQELWEQWWPKQNNVSHSKRDSAFIYNGYTYLVNRRIADDIEVIMLHEKDTIGSIINILPVSNDTSQFEWKCKIEAGFSPLARIQKYFQAADIKKNMDDITKSLSAFVAKKENIYGLKIEQVKVVDTLLVTYKTILKNYPTTQKIYGYINELKNYVASQGAKETNPPMLHLEQMDSSLYGLMVAIPVDRVVSDKGDILFKRMPHGNILISPEIRGGINHVTRSYEAMNNFVTDYQRISPGLSFMSLITDRVKEPDSSKWITKIYYPVF